MIRLRGVLISKNKNLEMPQAQDAFSPRCEVHSSTWRANRFDIRPGERSMLAGFSFPERLFPVGVPLPKELRRGRTVANPHLFPWVFDSSVERVSYHVHRLGSIDLLLSIVHNLHCFIFPLPLHLPLGCSIARRGLLQVAVTRR